MGVSQAGCVASANGIASPVGGGLIRRDSFSQRMNIHHLELFYYVARHGGISEAVRKIPYGIQQPAVSAQVGQLEQSLGLTLFQRRPFGLTGAGQELFTFIQPFFENLEKVAARLRSGVSQHVRLGASEIVLREHLPSVLQEVRG